MDSFSIGNVAFQRFDKKCFIQGTRKRNYLLLQFLQSLASKLMNKNWIVVQFLNMPFYVFKINTGKENFH
jgi:hypothetical protein